MESFLHKNVFLVDNFITAAIFLTTGKDNPAKACVWIISTYLANQIAMTLEKILKIQRTAKKTDQ